MNLFLLSNSWKSSLSSRRGNELLRRGLSFLKEAEFVSFPMADGGDGTLEAVESLLPGRRKRTRTRGATLDSTQESEYFLSGRTAYLEGARTCGLALAKGRGFEETTTYGIGEQILDARKEGCRKIVVGLGGSASNDLGLGMLSALGMRFYDRAGGRILPTTGTIGEVDSFDPGELEENVQGLSFVVLSDVLCPLLGPEGATMRFALQKGARRKDLDRWEGGFRRLVGLFEGGNPKTDRIPGSGAAGGLGYAFLQFLHADLRMGSSYLFEECGLDRLMHEGDVLVTGEGKIDKTSRMGKAFGFLERFALSHGLLFLAFAAEVDVPPLDSRRELFLPLSEGEWLTPENLVERIFRRRKEIEVFLSGRERSLL